MAFTIKIDSVGVDIKQESVSIEKRIEERSIASFAVIDRDGDGDYVRGMPVSIYDAASTLIFAGFIDNPGQAQLSASGWLLHDITCMDNHYLADKRLVVKAYTNQTLAYIVNDIWTDYLDAEGITIGEVQTGPTIKSAIFNYVKVSEAFDSLKELSSFIWYIDEVKALYFIDRSTNAAPWNLDNSTYKPIQGSVHLSTGNPLYRNRQYIRGGTAVTSEQTETFAGDAVTVAFTVGYPLALEPTVTVGGVGQDVGIKGLESGQDCYWNKGDSTITFTTAPGNAVAVVVVYYGEYPLITVAVHPTEATTRAAIEGGTGIIEDIVTEVEHETSAGIQESAQAKITEYCRDAEKFIYQTHDSGLAPGQLQAITYAPFGFSAHDMLIESVSISSSGDYVLYDISCITGPAMGSWAKFFSRILERQDRTIKIGDSLLLALLQQSEDLDLSEETAYHTDDFSGGLVNRWIALPPAQSVGHNIEHEALALVEAPVLAETLTEYYYWQ